MFKIKRKHKKLIKENKNLITIVLATALILFVFIFYCIFNKRFDYKKFNKIMQKEGFEIHNVTDQFTEEFITHVSVAYNNKPNYQIEFIQFTDEKAAKNVFILNKESFMNQKKEEDIEESISNNKISKYSLTTNDKYMLVSRKDNTLIYLIVDGSFKNEVNNILRKMGY